MPPEKNHVQATSMFTCIFMINERGPAFFLKFTVCFLNVQKLKKKGLSEKASKTKQSSRSGHLKPEDKYVLLFGEFTAILSPHTHTHTYTHACD